MPVPPRNQRIKGYLSSNEDSISPDFEVHDDSITITIEDLRDNADCSARTRFQIEQHEGKDTTSPIIWDASVQTNLKLNSNNSNGDFETLQMVNAYFKKLTLENRPTSIFKKSGVQTEWHSWDVLKGDCGIPYFLLTQAFQYFLSNVVG